MKTHSKDKSNLKTLSPAPGLNVPVNTSFDGEIFAKLERYRKVTGLPHCQDVVRIAVALFLKNTE